MWFHSRFLNHEPFSTLGLRRYAPAAKTLAQKAEDNLQNKIVPLERVMYRGGNDKIFDSETRCLFTGIVRIDSGKDGLFERILRIVNGSEKTSLVRIKKGKNYQAEIVGGKAKLFETGLPPEKIDKELEKMREADEAFYKKMKENFSLRKLFIKKK